MNKNLIYLKLFLLIIAILTLIFKDWIIFKNIPSYPGSAALILCNIASALLYIILLILIIIEGLKLIIKD